MHEEVRELPSEKKSEDDATFDVESSDTIVGMYQQHGADLRRFAHHKLGGDWHRAEDLLQEAMLRAWLQLRRRPERELRVKPWLKTVIKNLAIDEFRSHGSRFEAAADVETDDHEATDHTRSVLTELIIRDAMRDLSDNHRQILQRVYILDLSISTVAEELGIPSGTVKSRSYHAVRALRSALVTRGVTRDMAV
ncbi:sigma-70 family RNA polymerase sigma factor [Streptomyces sp. ISL-12]|uniref:sigma-70 family RNA polymerase sigma factor n=1 Tax=Streptomyces sp. ISL-12 TaxID=2819177 RepID=UPI001BE53B3B|nr:sigma-70 family RNA polymerase sigma factor [Streptomyces sp. ISL-12]MBT2413306.1 sigma-70 family RNA polymerase sigma factor [Streptomyces sp. ISL-12]